MAASGWMHAARVGGVPLRNFGDELSARVVEYAFGREARWSSAGRADLFAVGSIVEKAVAARKACDIWGSGVRGHSALATPSARMRFSAVRGQFSRAALGLDVSTALGDPALLLREQVGRVGGGSNVVFIPHYHAFNSRANREAIEQGKNRGWQIVSPTQSLETVLEAMRGACIVLSSSLHGKIVADAMGVPSIFVSFKNRTEPDFKYQDYLSVWNQQLHFHPVDELVEMPQRVMDRARRERDEIDAMIDSVNANLLRAAQSLGI